MEHRVNKFEQTQAAQVHTSLGKKLYLLPGYYEGLPLFLRRLAKTAARWKRFPVYLILLIAFVLFLLVMGQYFFSKDTPPERLRYNARTAQYVT